MSAGGGPEAMGFACYATLATLAASKPPSGAVAVKDLPHEASLPDMSTAATLIR